MRVLVTGATGLIGKTLCQSLAQEGHEISFLTRRPETAQVVPGARAFAWNAENQLPPEEAFADVEAVVHLAGEPIAASRWTNEQKRRIRDSRVIGTQNLIAGMRKCLNPPKVLISGSAVGYYGTRGDQQLDEDSAPGRGFLPDICIEWEKEAERAREFGVRVVPVRIGVVLGINGGALDKMLLPFKLCLGGKLGNGQQWFPWIHIDDIAGIIRHAMLNDQITGAVNGVAPGIVTNEQFTKELAAALNRPTFLPVPEFALHILMGEMAEVVLNSQRVFPRVALNSGYRFIHPNLKQALGSILN